MKNLPIKLRISIWYASFLLFALIAALTFMFTIGSFQTQSTMKKTLVRSVDRVVDEIEFDFDELKFNDDIDFLSHGVYLTIYDAKNAQLAGKTPKAITTEPEFRSEMLQITKDDSGAKWYVYDRFISDENYDGCRVRGYASMTDAESTVSIMLRLALFSMPLLVLFAVGGGYFITCQAFHPVMQIAKTAEQIGTSQDLSRRIGLQYSNDELHSLADTFDRMLDKLEDAFKKEKQFTADASHEMRTPIAVIISQSEYALEHSEESSKVLSVILQQAKRMSVLQSQLLMLAKSDNHKLQLQFETLDLGELCEMVVMQQREIADKKGITIHMESVPHLLIRADETMMIRMLMNLIENAIRYGNRNGNVWVSLEKGVTGIVGCVRDDGIGIRKEYQKKIWDRFYRADASRNTQGSGLGLSMVKWIVETHGGTIYVESILGKGSSFIFNLPI